MADINALDQKNTQSKLDSLLTAAFNLTGVNITNIAAEQTAYTTALRKVGLMIKIIKGGLNEFNDELLIATATGDYNKVQNLAQEGDDINTSDNHKQYPLHYATYSGNLEITEYLIDKGADVKAK
ncbi:Ankyrin repeat-containing domain,Ankyrin repeat [Cinara cedri]|uniref:Ankyrin repeat-containing domain,Ankyrin repeat n=1 Tax=Cinara cedri TaxID=506608 RepID=A0A5E4N4Q4_9HEMI|nr:Ankyrin repeat-containing domain,Ankyrin repeat [Cinara cedri]